jgi:Phosphate-selective porin O and P
MQQRSGLVFRYVTFTCGVALSGLGYFQEGSSVALAQPTTEASASPDTTIPAPPTDPGLTPEGYETRPGGAPAAQVEVPADGVPLPSVTMAAPAAEPRANRPEPYPVVATRSTAVSEPQKVSTPVEVTGAPGQGLTVAAGEVFSLNVKSRIQVRYQLNAFDDPSRETQQLVNIGTARIWLGGHVYTPKLTYLIQLAVAGKDYRDGATSPIFDAYLEWRAHRDFSVRAGQYFVPFDRLRTVREWGLQLAERPRPVQEFTLDRDVGVTFFSERFLGDDSPVAWYLSAFGGHGTNQVNPSAVGGLLTGRVELRPLGPIDDDREGDLDRREKPGLALGVGAAHNYKSSRVRSTTGPTFVGGTTNDTYVAADLTFKWMGFAVQGEYLYKDTSVLSFESELGDGETLTEYTHEGGGWVAQASYAFDPPFEVVARLSRLYYGSTIEPAFINDVNRRGNELAGGLNYYFNGHRMKAQATWVGRTNADLALGKADHLAVVQVDATF